MATPSTAGSIPQNQLKPEKDDMTVNKVVRISISGGILDHILTNPRQALEKRIREENTAGWHAIQITYHEANILILCIRAIVLIITFFMWISYPGYIVLFAKSHQPSHPPPLPMTGPRFNQPTGRMPILHKHRR